MPIEIPDGTTVIVRGKRKRQVLAPFEWSDDEFYSGDERRITRMLRRERILAEALGVKVPQ